MCMHSWWFLLNYLKFMTILWLGKSFSVGRNDNYFYFIHPPHEGQSINEMPMVWTFIYARLTHDCTLWHEFHSVHFTFDVENAYKYVFWVKHVSENDVQVLAGKIILTTRIPVHKYKSKNRNS